jgi:tetratricopeptide (TPR) repeat protein
MQSLRSLLTILPLLSAFTFAQVAGVPNLVTHQQDGPALIPTVLVGKVTAERASAAPEGVSVLLECNGQVRTRSDADSKGQFGLTVIILDSMAAGAAPPVQPRSVVIENQEWSGCELYGELSGYQSERVRLLGVQTKGMVDVGTIILHPVAPAQDAFVSVNSLAAPESAKKAVEKGREQEKKGRWAAAVDYFRKAISVYPRYALAWMELGRAQIRQNDFHEAEQSLQQAVTDDSGMLAAYVELARVAAMQRQWKQLADVSDHLIEAAPDSSAEFWFLNSAANFNLGKVDRAQTSIERGLRLDPNHQVPQMEYLYGMILGSKHQYQSAADHLNTYLELQPSAPDAQTARQQLAKYQQMAASSAPQQASR